MTLKLSDDVDISDALSSSKLYGDSEMSHATPLAFCSTTKGDYLRHVLQKLMLYHSGTVNTIIPVFLKYSANPDVAIRYTSSVFQKVFIVLSRSE